MICPKCRVRMVVRQSYKANSNTQTQRLECPECRLIGTAIRCLVNLRPDYGQGACHLAKKIEAGAPLPVPLEVKFVEPKERPPQPTRSPLPTPKTFLQAPLPPCPPEPPSDHSHEPADRGERRGRARSRLVASHSQP